MHFRNISDTNEDPSLWSFQHKVSKETKDKRWCDRQRVSSRDRENTWLSWAKFKTVAECLGSGFLFGKWMVGLITPVSFITPSNLTKWEENQHKGLWGIGLFPKVRFLASRGLPLSLSPQRLSSSSFPPVSCIICQICLIWIRRNNCFTSSALTDLHRYGHPRDNETLTDLLVAKV